MSLRHQYSVRLEEIRTDIVRMGGRATEMVRMAVDAALNGDVALATKVIETDSEVNEMERATLQKAILIVLQEAPVAGDYRMLISALGIVSEIEQVADDAVKLARRAKKLHGRFPSEMKRALLELGEHSKRSFNTALRLYTEYSEPLAQEIVELDEEIDSRYAEARNRIFELIRQNPSETEHLVRTIEAFHALEHVADHAVAIAHRLKILHDSGGASSSGAS